MRKLLFLVPCLLSSTPLPTFASVPAIPASLPVGESQAALAEGTARIVASILSYSHWPVAPAPVRLCVAGPAEHADGLDTLSLLQGGRVERRNVPPGAPALGGACDAIYIGRLSSAATRQIAASVRGLAVVTIAEADPDCRSQAMFCLVHVPGSLTFRMNIDAVSRSAVRIDPRVLRMARGY